MFIRRQKLSGTSRTAILICESKRYGKKVKSITLKYFGIAHSSQELKEILKIAERELTLLKQASFPPAPPPPTPKIEHLQEESRILDGFHDIFSPFFQALKLQKHFSKKRYAQLQEVVLSRIIEPVSKRNASRFLQRSRQTPLSEDSIYRLMDAVHEHHESIRTHVFETTLNFSKKKEVVMVFFDVTTLYFESQKQDALRGFGYSKDHKANETQIVLALATTHEGLPIGYTLFSGKTAETKTLMVCLEEWKKHLPIAQATVIADRAMMSDANLTALEEAGMKYVIAAKLKGLPQNLTHEILSQSHQTPTEHIYKNRRLIVSHSESRARKTESDRNRSLQKLQAKIPTGITPTHSLLPHPKFLSHATFGTTTISQEKIDQEALWDGLHGVITNDTTTSAHELLTRYRQLWVIEESFRLNKHALAMLPIYHFKQERIETHILICYLSFATLRYAEKKIRERDPDLTIHQIREELSHVESSIVNDGFGNTYRIPSKLTALGERIYQAAGVKRLAKVEKVA